jgi:hypothetical protein
VVLSFDPAFHDAFWLVRDYLPEIASLEPRAPGLERLAEGLRATRIEEVPIPWDCSDGFLAAYWRRPERYLDADVRRCISALAQLDERIVSRAIGALRSDLESGCFERRHAELLARDAMDYGYRLLVAEPAAEASTDARSP